MLHPNLTNLAQFAGLSPAYFPFVGMIRLLHLELEKLTQVVGVKPTRIVRHLSRATRLL